jgi:cellobiose dehydrogenase (acceptor)
MLQMLVAYSNRRANHWIGTAKIGTDDGRVNNGTAVVDLNTKVYGTDNIFVVDGSIFPGMPTTNPSAYIVVAAEHASHLILALPYPGNPNGGHSSSSSSKVMSSTKSASTKSASSSASHTSVVPTTTTTKPVTTTTTAKTSSKPTTTIKAPPPPPPPGQPEWSQCGGIGYTGVTQCASGLSCRQLNPYYYQCLS